MTVHRMEAIPGKFKGRKAKKARPAPGTENPNAVKPARQVAEPDARHTKPGRDQGKK